MLWGSVAALALLGPSRALLLPSLAAYSTAFLAFLQLWRRHRELLDDPRVLLGGALVLRLTLLPTLPDLSDDLYRYVWDGWLALSGVNPFAFPPSAPELASFQESILFREMNSRDFHSIYPPLSQIVFLVGGAAYERFGWPAAAYAVKAVFLALEAVGVVLIYLALRAGGLRPGALALYAWNPLVLVTVAGAGHTEGGLMLGLGLLALSVARQAPARAWIGLALAAASKGLPILLAPLLFRHQVPALGIRRTLGAAAPGAVLGALLLAPYLPELVTAVGASADLYVRLFEFNGGPYLLLKEGLVLLTGEDWGRLLGPALRWVFLGGALLVWIRSPVAGRDWFRASVLVFALYLATATTVHPWYLLWGLAYVPFTPLLRGTWLWASWAAYLTYFTYVDVPHGALAAVFWIGAAAFSLRDIEGPARDRLLRIAGRRKARQIVRHIEGRRILDLGAAEGYVADRLRAPGRSLLLMDVGPFFRVPLPGVVYDGRRIPLGDRSVDTVLISLALHHARAPAEVVSEALRVARRRVVVTESTYRWGLERRLLRIADRVANRGRGFERDPAGAGPPHFRTLGEWSDLFGRSGARVLSVERLNRIGHRHVAFVLVPSRTGQTSAPHEPHSPSR